MIAVLCLLILLIVKSVSAAALQPLAARPIFKAKMHGWQLHEIDDIMSAIDDLQYAADMENTEQTDGAKWMDGQGFSCTDNNTIDGTCYITGVQGQQLFPVALYVNVSVVISGCNAVFPPCGSRTCLMSSFIIITTGNITITDSSFLVATTLLSASNIYIDANSTIIGDAMGPKPIAPYETYEGTLGTGGGHAGTGSVIYTCRNNVPLPKPVGGIGFGFENISYPFDFGGGSTPFYPVTPDTTGGGRVWIEAIQAVTIAGTVSVNGQDSVGTQCRCEAGGGAGGSIFVGGGTVNCGSGQFYATGGTSTYTGGGGGGIISFVGGVVSTPSSTNIDVSGGATMDTCCQTCPIGGTGVIFRQQLVARFGTYAEVQASQYAKIHPYRDAVVSIKLPTRDEFEVERKLLLQDCIQWMRATRKLFTPNVDALHTIEHDTLVTEDSKQRGTLANPQVFAKKAQSRTVSGVKTDTTNYHVTTQKPLQTHNPNIMSNEEVCKLHFPDYFDEAQLSVVSNSLACQSSGSSYSPQAPMTATAVTYLDSSNNVAMSNCAWDLSGLPSVSLVSWKVGSSNVQAEGLLLSVNGTFAIIDLSRVYTSANVIMTLHVYQSFTIQQSLLDAGTLSINTPMSFSITNQAYTRFTFAAYLSVGTLQLQSVLQQVDIPPVSTTIVVYASNVTMLQESQMLAGAIQLNIANTVVINGGITAAQTLSNTASCPAYGHAGPPVPAVQTVDCSSLAGDLAGFTLWIHANYVDIQKSGEILGSTIRVCASNVNVEASAIIVGDGLGCGSESGFGAGNSQQPSASSGAGHGGAGGAGYSSDGTIVVQGGVTYDNVSAPRMLGSGGGDGSLGGNGGGLIWMDVANLLTVNGFISALGAQALPAVTPTGAGGGGGSGGAFIMQLGGLTGLSGQFDFSGGNGAAPSGGGGGGGTINILWLNTSSAESVRHQSWYDCIRQQYDGSNLQATVLPTTRHDFFGMCEYTSPSVLSPIADIPSTFKGEFKNLGGGGAAPGLSGLHGVSLSIPSCLLGQGGALCLPCDMGSYKDTAGNNLPCMPCAPGFFANTTGATSCLPCPAGSVANEPGSDHCRLCDPGFLPNANFTKCDLCELGHGGTTCTPCSPGSAKNDTSQDRCQYCPPGTAAPVQGMTVCTPCKGGKAPSWGTVTCIACDSGSISQPPYVNCSVCPPGTFASQAGDVCVGCPPNYYSNGGVTECSVCDPGYFSKGNATVCSACPPKPSHASWVPPSVLADDEEVTLSTVEFCVFVCEQGYVHWPECLLPIHFAFDKAGGLPLFVMLAVASLLTLVPGIIAWRKHGSNRTLHAWVPDTEQNQSGMSKELDAYFGLIKYPPPATRQSKLCGWSKEGEEFHDEQMIHSPTASRSSGPLRDRLLSKTSNITSPLTRATSAQFLFGVPPGGPTQDTMFHQRSATAYTGLTGAAMLAPPTTAAAASSALKPSMFVPQLPVQDLARHVERIFFMGNNTPYNPLALDATVPAELASVLIEHEFIDHAEEINLVARWKGWEVRMANLLRLVYHPIALAFESGRRAAHVRALAETYADLDHTFLKNTRARALGNCVRFGHSLDYTLAWIDILASEAHDESFGVIGQPRYPAVIPCAGDGSFMNPFHVELSDPLNVALLSLLSPDFQSIIIGLNNMLRLLRGPTMSPGLRRRPRYKPDDYGFPGGLSLNNMTDEQGMQRRTRPAGSDASGGDDDESFRLRKASAADDGNSDSDEEDVLSRAAEGRYQTADYDMEGCFVFPGQNSMRRLESQPGVNRIQEYLAVVNNTLAERSKVAKKAQDVFARKRSAHARRTSTMVHRQKSSDLTVDSNNIPISEDKRMSTGDERSLENALRWVPFGFPDDELSLYFGKIPGVMDATFDRPCIILLPRTAPAPTDDGHLPFALPYGAHVLAHAAAPSLLQRTLGLSVMRQTSAVSTAATATANKLPERQRRHTPGSLRQPSRSKAAIVPSSAAAQTGTAAVRRDALLYRRRNCCATITDTIGRGGQYVPALRNSRATGSFNTVTSALQFALMVELLCVVLILSEFFTLVPDIGVLISAFPPIMLGLSPVVGHIALVTREPLLHRIHSSMELFSGVAAVIALCSGIYYTVYGPLDYIGGVIVPAVLLLTKLLILRLTNARTALLELQFEAERFEPAGVVYVREVLASTAAAQQQREDHTSNDLLSPIAQSAVDSLSPRR